MALSYSEEEIYLLANTPHMIGAAIAFAGKSGVFGTGKEMFVNAQSILSGVKDYPDNELIQAILPSLDEGRKEAMEKVKQCRSWAVARMKEKGINSPDKMQLQALEDSQTIAKLLASKSPSQEAVEYKQWAISVAEKVAMASTEGGFLGFGGERFSEPERQLLSELKKALGTGSTLA